MGFGIFVLATTIYFDSLGWDIQFEINEKQNTFLPARLLCKFIRLLASPESRLHSQFKISQSVHYNKRCTIHQFAPRFSPNNYLQFHVHPKIF